MRARCRRSSFGIGEPIDNLAFVGQANAPGSADIAFSGDQSFCDDPFFSGPGFFFTGLSNQGLFAQVDALGDVDGDGLDDYGYTWLDYFSGDEQAVVRSAFGSLAVFDIAVFGATNEWAELTGAATSTRTGTRTC